MNQHDTEWEALRDGSFVRVCEGRRCFVKPHGGGDQAWHAIVEPTPAEASKGEVPMLVGVFATSTGAKRAATIAAQGGEVKAPRPPDYAQASAESQLARLRAGLVTLGMQKKTQLVDKGSHVEEVPVEGDHWVKGGGRSYVEVSVDHPATLVNAYRKTYNVRGTAVINNRRKDGFSSSASPDKLHIGVSQALNFVQKWKESVA